MGTNWLRSTLLFGLRGPCVGDQSTGLHVGGAQNHQRHAFSTHPSLLGFGLFRFLRHCSSAATFLHLLVPSFFDKIATANLLPNIILLRQTITFHSISSRPTIRRSKKEKSIIICLVFANEKAKKPTSPTSFVYQIGFARAFSQYIHFATSLADDSTRGNQSVKTL